MAGLSDGDRDVGMKGEPLRLRSGALEECCAEQCVHRDVERAGPSVEESHLHTGARHGVVGERGVEHGRQVAVAAKRGADEAARGLAQVRKDRAGGGFGERRERRRLPEPDGRTS